MTPDYFVRYLPFPARVGAVVVPNDDGSFDIYISSRLSDDAQRERLEHELTHIRRDHFYRPIPVAVAEAEANGAPPPPVPAPSAAPTSPAVTDAWLLSWQKAMAWAEEMMKQQGWPDVDETPAFKPPLCKGRCPEGAEGLSTSRIVQK